VLAFRDDSRLTLGAATRFKVDSFVFDDKNPGEGVPGVAAARLDACADRADRAANNRNVGFAHRHGHHRHPRHRAGHAV
jgi:hypothetical protein